jgi:hypothetical protein
MCAAMSRGTQNAVWTLLVVMTALVGGIIAVRAQESEPSSASLKRIRAALQSPQQPISRAAHSVAAAQHRRAERAAGDEVAKALAEFQRAQPK